MKLHWNQAAGAMLGFAVVAAVQPVWAQEIPEIVVTARKQGEEKLMETPLAITAFDANAIENRNITNMQDVANLTPGLSFYNPLGENLPTPVIRGIVPQNIFGENAAAVFVDGVYVSGREGLNFSQLDIERIEVLKGPQSSTYGRNAFSGAINYVTKGPSDVFESKFEGEVGNRDRRKISGQVSGPILGELLGNTLTGRVAALYDDWDGSYDNTLAPQNDIGGYRYRSYMGKLRWLPSDDLDVNFSIYRSNDEIDEAGVGGLLVNCEPTLRLTKADVDGSSGERLQNWCGKIPKLKYLQDMLDGSTFPNPTTIPGSVRRDGMPKNPLATGEDRDVVRSNLNIAWDTDVGTLTSLTGYSHTKQSSVSDFERSSGDTLPFIYCYPSSNFNPPTCESPYSWSRAPMGFIDREDGATYEEWSQEIRFTSPREQRLRWQVGTYYFHFTHDQRQGNPVATTQLPGDWGPGGNIAVGPVALPTTLAIGSYIFGQSLLADGAFDPLNRTRLYNNERSWSVFGSTDFDVTEKLTARAELRYTQDYKRSMDYTYATCVDPNTFPFGDDPADPACGDDVWDLREVAPIDYPSGKARFNNTTGRLGLKYALDSGWMAYGSVAYGEKPGGVSVASQVDVVVDGVISQETIDNRFDPEKMTAYEIGLKGYTPDRRVRFDLAMYFNDWRDIVLRQLSDTNPMTGHKFTQPRALDANAGDAHVFGWEASADIGITENLSGRLTVGYTDAELKKARQDTYALFPTFYTTLPQCAPAAIQGLPVADQAAVAGQCKELSGDVAGNTQMRQPRWTASSSLDYTHQFIGDWDIRAGVAANYISKMYMGNDNQNWVPPHTNVNLNIGVESARYTISLWMRNVFNNDEPLSAFRDIYWTNDADMAAIVPAGTGTIRNVSTFDDFPPLRMSIAYPNLRTYGLTARVRFGGAEK